MSEDPTELSPALPAELEQTIFEMAAHIRPLSIPRFMLVAWRVKIWVEPLLFRTIVLSQRPYDPQNLQGHIPAFESDILLPIIQSESRRFLAASVHNLLLPPWISSEDATAVLSACTSIEDLWLGLGSGSGGEMLSVIEDLPLKRLYCCVEDIFGPLQQIDFTHRLFTRITHFEIFDGNIEPEIWHGLALLPHLTHLCFTDERFTDICLTLLTTCKSLRVLVVLQPTLRALIAEHPDEEKLSKDPRFVAMDCEWETKDWRMGAHTGIDYWSRAEDFIAKRRSGEIDPLQYTIEADASIDIA